MAGCPPLLAFGVSMVAPVIWTFGNDEQKKRFLPDILDFNTWYKKQLFLQQLDL